MDKQKTLRIEEIFLPPSEVGSDYYCENFVVFPDGKEQFGGHILGIIEINATLTDHAKRIVQTIISSLKDHYYRQIVTSPEPHKLNLETVFEHALQKTNEQALQLIQNGQIQLILENVNFLISVVKQKENESDIFFTHRGNIQALLIHKTKQSNYKIIDILAGMEKEPVNQVKIFSSIISGKIFEPDTMLVCNESFARFFSKEKINQLVTGRPLKEVIEDFKVLLHKRPPNYAKTYSAVFLKQEELEMAEQSQVSQKSINQLMTTQQHTEKFLTPIFSINIKSKIKNLFQKLLSIFSLKAKKTNQTSAGSSNNLFKKIHKKFKSLFYKSPEKTEYKVEKDKAAKPTKSKKWMLAGLFVLIVIFALSIFWIYSKRQEKQEITQYNQSINQVENKLNQAEASFLFRNTEKSQQLLAEAKNLMNKLPNETPEQKNEMKALTQTFQSLQNKIIKLETVSADQVINISPITTSPQISLLGENTLIAADNDTINIIDLESNQITGSLDTQVQQNIISSAKFNENSLFALFNDNLLYQYSKEDNSWQQITLKDKGSWTDFEIYNSHLYFLDSENNQIYKYRNVGSSSFGPPSDWLNESVDFSDANSLAIDGNIYVLSANGNIQKFLTGGKQNFSVPKIEPALQNTREIHTDLESSFIYVLDKPSKRIIVLNKQGLLVVQYQIENVEKIDDLAIDEKNGIIYIIDHTKLWKIKMKHL